MSARLIDEVGREAKLSLRNSNTSEPRTSGIPYRVKFAPYLAKFTPHRVKKVREVGNNIRIAIGNTKKQTQMPAFAAK